MVKTKKRKIKPKREIRKEHGMPVIVKEEGKYAVVEPVEEKKKIEVKEEKPKEVEKPIEEIKPKERKLKEIPIDMVETDIDKLMKIIEEKKSVSVGDLSKELNLKVEQIENWAKILEERGLIEIEYPIIGLPKLRKKEWKEES